uniref:protein-serine/threonine phosphatase n=1 Tax=Steinernema glaseri TaxID=37863 RepID=A0A1I7XYS8_9BILA
METKKLILLVDLDNTLICSNRRGQSKKDAFVVADDAEAIKVKIRPYCAEFLERMAEIYSMHVVTLSCKAYAQAIVKRLDPAGRLFQRVLSRTELGSVVKKTEHINELFPVGLARSVILDDRVDVWDHRENVVQVKAFHWSDEKEEEPVLQEMERILTIIHRSYFSLAELVPDTAKIVGNYRRSILNGFRVRVEGGNPNRRVEVAQRLTSFGARTKKTLTGSPTLVVDLTREKRKADENATIPVVSDKWVDAVETRWSIPDVKEFLLGFQADQ